jgi:hypothetical protein
MRKIFRATLVNKAIQNEYLSQQTLWATIVFRNIGSQNILYYYGTTGSAV